MSSLSPGTTLQDGKYRIVKTLGNGGFGITYLAVQTGLQRRVCIKEFFMKDYCYRRSSTQVILKTGYNRALVERFRKKFIKEARTIFDLEHPSIVRTIDHFEENGTAYYAMDYIDGSSLLDIVTEQGVLSTDRAIAYTRQIAEALGYIHDRHINHLDIKPANIMVRNSDAKVVIIDFGIAKHYDESSGGQTTTTPSGMSHGYAPLEQYRQGGVASFTPQTDIYALGATLYFMLTGNRPPQATDLIDTPLTFPPHVEAPLQRIVTAAMAVSKTKRPANVKAFLTLINNEMKHTAVDVTPTDPAQLYQEGFNYYHGRGVKQDYAEAVRSYRQAAELGHASAQNYLGVCYEHGRSVKQDYTKAARWYRKAAEQGEPYAQCNLGLCYEYGRGVEQDYAEAARWYRKAAEQGHATAQCNLGYCYDVGQGVEQDYPEAIHWYRNAAEQGHATAQNNLGICYENGQGVEQDYAEAARLYRKAAEQGEPYAQRNLGVCYENGQGVKKSRAKAARWYRKAAKQGHEGAKKNLATILEKRYFRIITRCAILLPLFLFTVHIPQVIRILGGLIAYSIVPLVIALVQGYRCQTYWFGNFCRYVFIMILISILTVLFGIPVLGFIQIAGIDLFIHFDTLIR